MKAWALAALSVLCLFPTLALGQSEKVETIGPLQEAFASDAVRQSLESKGYRLMADGAPIAEIWVRAEVPAQPKKEAEGVLYSQLNESEFVGVVHFPETATDFRGDSVAAGYYTLRYALMPNDGNHMGAAPSRDFLLLIPIKNDPDPKATFNFENLVALSRKATGIKHPGPLSLTQSAGGSSAALSKNEEGHSVFSFNLKVAGGWEMPVALVVKGVAQQ